MCRWSLPTIDNDIDCTDVTFDHDTALTVATAEAIDRLSIVPIAESHERVMLVEVMGIRRLDRAERYWPGAT